MHAIYTRKRDDGKKIGILANKQNASKKGVCGLNVEKQQRLGEK